MPIDNPIVLLTRHEAGAERFIVALKKACERPFTIVKSPVFEFEATAPVIEDSYDVAIFTSAHAASLVGDARGRVAYCVGTQTSQQASAKGFDVRNADGNANSLIERITVDRPTGRVVHFRGEVSVGDVVANLLRSDIPCSEHIVYRKVPIPLTGEARTALDGKQPIVLPLFSPESGAMFFTNAPFRAPLHVCALSTAVARKTAHFSPDSVQICARPRLEDMVALVAAQIA